jgi:hypothetical protein
MKFLPPCLRVFFLSLFYNCHLSWPYAFDTAMEPLFWAVDNFAKILGPLFVSCAVAATSAVVAISYHLGLPYYRDRKAQKKDDQRDSININFEHERTINDRYIWEHF